MAYLVSGSYLPNGVSMVLSLEGGLKSNLKKEVAEQVGIPCRQVITVPPGSYGGARQDHFSPLAACITQPQYTL